MLLAAWRRRVDPTEKFAIVHPRHVSEIASAIEALGRAADAIPVACTSLGLQISAGSTRVEGAPVTHFTVSSRGRRMTRKAAHIVADLIQQLGRASARPELLGEEDGIFHLLLSRPGTAVKP
jgi:hypothetical protein